MKDARLTKLFIILIACLMLVTSACATKKYVRNRLNERVTPLEGRTAELEEGSKDLKRRTGELEMTQDALRKDIRDVDSRAAAGIEQAKLKAAEAQNQAIAAQDEARLSNTRVDNLDTWEEADQVVINFKINQARLTPEDKDALDQLANQIKQEKGYMIEIRGFADSSGSLGRNQVLSEARAKAVFQYLATEHDIPLHKMNIVGFGEVKPVSDNKSRQGRADNRRVEVKLFTNAGIRRTPVAQPSNQSGRGKSTGSVGQLKP
ncbi:MAG: OmpA family protein [Acidobacteriota bacterium]